MLARDKFNLIKTALSELRLSEEKARAEILLASKEADSIFTELLVEEKILSIPEWSLSVNDHQGAYLSCDVDVSYLDFADINYYCSFNLMDGDGRIEFNYDSAYIILLKTENLQKLISKYNLKVKLAKHIEQQEKDLQNKLSDILLWKKILP